MNEDEGQQVEGNDPRRQGGYTDKELEAIFNRLFVPMMIAQVMLFAFSLYNWWVCLLRVATLIFQGSICSQSQVYII